MPTALQGTAGSVVAGPFLSVSDGKTLVSSLTTASTLNGQAISGGTASAFTPSSLSYLQNGLYAVGYPSGTFTTPGPLTLSFSDPATFLPVRADLQILAPAISSFIYGTNAPMLAGGQAVVSGYLSGQDPASQVLGAGIGPYSTNGTPTNIGLLLTSIFALLTANTSAPAITSATSSGFTLSSLDWFYGQNANLAGYLVGLASGGPLYPIATSTGNVVTVGGQGWPGESANGIGYQIFAPIDKTGFSLAPTGLELVLVENGVNARQALAPILAAAAGAIIGNAGGSPTVSAPVSGSPARIAATIAGGDRTATVLTFPTLEQLGVVSESP